MEDRSLLYKYAELLVSYCVELKPGERLYVSSTTQAEPLVREVWRKALQLGALVEVDLTFREQERIFLNAANPAQLEYIPVLYQQAMEEFDAYIHIRAPYNLREEQNVDSNKSNSRREALKPVTKSYFERTATKSLKRNLCQYPTLANAQEADMSLEEYEHFVFNACKLFEANPAEAWLLVRKNQQRIVDYLNRCTKVRYRSPNLDITFGTNGRTWINSDGQANMPSGEVFTAPVEEEVNGYVHFDYPVVYAGHLVEGITLWVKDGYIEKWEAKQGGKFLEKVLELPGARRFGEAAIGTNYEIDRFTRNILFDEKIGGTMHMAIGQSYLQAGGKNQSPIHWDLIADMTTDGEIFADDELIYRNGKFLI